MEHNISCHSQDVSVAMTASTSLSTCPSSPTLTAASSPSSSRSAAHMSGDIGAYQMSELSQLHDKERLWLLQNTFRPNSDYCSPPSPARGVWEKAVLSTCLAKAISMAFIFSQYMWWVLCFHGSHTLPVHVVGTPSTCGGYSQYMWWVLPVHVVGTVGTVFLVCGNLGQLVTTPMINSTRAKVTLQEHNSQSVHVIAMEDC